METIQSAEFSMDEFIRLAEQVDSIIQAPNHRYETLQELFANTLRDRPLSVVVDVFRILFNNAPMSETLFLNKLSQGYSSIHTTKVNYRSFDIFMARHNGGSGLTWANFVKSFDEIVNNRSAEHLAYVFKRSKREDASVLYTLFVTPNAFNLHYIPPNVFTDSNLPVFVPQMRCRNYNPTSEIVSEKPSSKFTFKEDQHMAFVNCVGEQGWYIVDTRTRYLSGRPIFEEAIADITDFPSLLDSHQYVLDVVCLGDGKFCIQDIVYLHGVCLKNTRFEDRYNYLKDHLLPNDNYKLIEQIEYNATNCVVIDKNAPYVYGKPKKLKILATEWSRFYVSCVKTLEQKIEVQHEAYGLPTGDSNNTIPRYWFRASERLINELTQTLDPDDDVYMTVEIKYDRISRHNNFTLPRFNQLFIEIIHPDKTKEVRVLKINDYADPQPEKPKKRKRTAGAATKKKATKAKAKSKKKKPAPVESASDDSSTTADEAAEDDDAVVECAAEESDDDEPEPMVEELPKPKRKKTRRQ